MKLSDFSFDTACMLQDGAFSTLATSAAPVKDMLTFIEQEAYLPEVLHNLENISCIIATPDLAPLLLEKGLGVLEAQRPNEVFFWLHNQLSHQSEYLRPARPSCIHPTAVVHSLACIAPQNVVIGPGCVVEEFASIKEHTTLAENAVVRAGSVVGGEGFQVRRMDGNVVPIAHCGGVLIEKNADIHQNSCVDRGLFPWQDTVVGEGTVVDNLVHVAHAVRLGKRVLVTAGAVIGGSIELADDAYVGTNATLAKGNVGRGGRVSSGSVTTRPVAEGQTVSGNFAVEHKRFIEHMKKFK